MAAGVRLATVVGAILATADSSVGEISCTVTDAREARVMAAGEAVRVKVVGVRLVKVVGVPRVTAARVRWSVAYRTTTGPSS